MANEDLQSFLGSVYNSLNASPSSSRGLGRATHVLGYMYLICQNSRLANILVNSSMMPLLLRLAQLQDSDVDAFKRHAERRSAPKPENVRARVAVVLAVLIRHSTYIAPAMCTYDEGGMLAALEALAKDAAPKVRRYGMAALCELIFYITTNAAAEEAQRRERSGSADGVHDATNLEWRVPASLLRLLVKTTRDPADAVLRACAVKTIENIMMSAAMGEVPAAATFLASHETLGHLRTIATSKSLPKDVRCSACNALCSLVRVDLKLMPRVAQGEGWGFLVGGLADDSHPTPMRRAYFNVVNYVFFAGRAVRESIFGAKSSGGSPHGEQIAATAPQTIVSRNVRQRPESQSSAVRRSLLRARYPR